MPTYDYECNKCGYRFELFQSINDEPLKICTKCDGEVRRIIGSGAGIIFKGSGFYKSDYKKTSCPESGNSSEKSCCSGSCTCTSSN